MSPSPSHTMQTASVPSDGAAHPDAVGTGRKPRRSPWPYAIVGLLTAHVGAMALAVKVAGSGASGHAILPEYYDRAVDWDELRAADARSAALGWTLQVAPATLLEESGARRVTLELLDSAGDAVTGAHVTVRSYHTGVGERTEATARELGHGIYAADLSMALPGDYELETKALQGTLEFVDRRTVRVAALQHPTR
jgi:hypothetical protein